MHNTGHFYFFIYVLMTTEITDKEIMKQTLDNGMSKKFIITTDV